MVHAAARHPRGASVAYDVVIRNGVVVDGTGGPAYRADVAIADGLIAKIGRIRGKGGQDLDAESCVVTPGFIDAHTHMDAQMFWDPLGSSTCWHGVTTAITGNCGFSLAPCTHEQAGLLMGNLERAEDIPRAAMESSIDWRWETFREYLDVVDALPKTINYSLHIGHSALRIWAMGERAMESGAGEDELRAMERQLRDALDAGAVGFTTSRSENHLLPDDRPVASRIASWDEVRRLVRAMADEGGGTFELAVDQRARRRDDPDARAEELERLRALAVESKVPMTFGLQPEADGYASQFALIEAANAAGGKMFGLSHSRGFQVVLSFKTQLPFDALPEWSSVRALPPHQQVRALADAEIRRLLVQAARNGSYRTGVGAEPRPPRFDRIEVLRDPSSTNPTVAELAEQQGKDPVELMIDLAVATDLDQLFLQTSTRLSDDLLPVLRHPDTVMTFSDAGAHVGQLIDCSIQTFLLSYWVRERQLLPIEEAVRMITMAPASKWGLQGRGVVREGYVADLNMIDLAQIGPEYPTVEHDLPTGAVRLAQRARGVSATLVAGRVVFLDGEHTGAMPGRVIRRQRLESTRR